VPVTGAVRAAESPATTSRRSTALTAVSFANHLHNAPAKFPRLIDGYQCAPLQAGKS